jgi:hypothetical protein
MSIASTPNHLSAAHAGTVISRCFNDKINRFLILRFTDLVVELSFIVRTLAAVLLRPDGRIYGG